MKKISLAHAFAWLTVFACAAGWLSAELRAKNAESRADESERENSCRMDQLLQGKAFPYVDIAGRQLSDFPVITQLGVHSTMSRNELTVLCESLKVYGQQHTFDLMEDFEFHLNQCDQLDVHALDFNSPEHPGGEDMWLVYSIDDLIVLSFRKYDYYIW